MRRVASAGEGVAWLRVVSARACSSGGVSDSKVRSRSSQKDEFKCLDRKFGNHPSCNEKDAQN